MSQLLVNDQSCSRCGICAGDCPFKLIVVEEGRYPAFIPGGSERCILCGHCEAVCPAGAIVVEDNRMDSRYNRYNPAVMEFDKLETYFRMRRSIRKFKPEPVDHETLLKLMNVVRHAPTGTNSQNVRWIILETPGEVKKLTDHVADWMRAMASVDSPLNSYFDFKMMVKLYEAGMDPICHNAPHLAIAHVHKDATSGPIDSFIALSHLDLLAPSLGLGTCWAGIFHIAVTAWAPLRAALNLPENHNPVYSMMIGIPDVKYLRPPKRNKLAVEWR